MSTRFLKYLIVVLLSSCQNIEYQKNIVNLKSFDFKLNVNSFYQNSFKKVDAKQIVYKSTTTEYDKGWGGDSNKIFSINYNVFSYSEDDIVAKYNNVNFFRLESMTNGEGNLMIINAETKTTEKNINMLISDITSDFNNEPIILERQSSFISESKILKWNNNDIFIKLIIYSKIDFPKPKLKECIIFIYKQKYVEKLEGGNFVSGNWAAF